MPADIVEYYCVNVLYVRFEVLSTVHMIAYDRKRFDLDAADIRVRSRNAVYSVHLFLRN